MLTAYLKVLAYFCVPTQVLRQLVLVRLVCSRPNIATINQRIVCNSQVWAS